MGSKRRVSILIPYKKDNDIFVYLQKRSENAKRIPGYFGFFGGGAEEDESPEEALRREMKEEINFIPEDYVHFKQYEFNESIKYIFILEVDDDFEEKIIVLEGEYGKWFGEKDILQEPKLIEEDKIVLKDFYLSLKIKLKNDN